MVDFASAGRLSAPNTQFTQVKPRQRPDVRASQLKTLVGGAIAVGGEVAKRSGEELTGADLTKAEVHQEVDVLAEDLDRRFASAMDVAEGPLSERTQIELKDESLTEHVNNVRTLKEAQVRGVISLPEARGREKLMLQRALSNPINNLFRGQFLNASKSLTGGSKGPVSELFPLSQEEMLAQSIQKETVKALAKEEADVVAMAASSGRSISFIRNERREQAEETRRSREIDVIKQTRALNGEEFSMQQGLTRNSVGRQIALQLQQTNQLNGGRGLGVDQLNEMNRVLKRTHRSMLESINENNTESGTFNIGTSQRDSEKERLDKWLTGMEAQIEDYNAATIDADKLAALNTVTEFIAQKNFPLFKLLDKINPAVTEFMLLKGGIEGLDAYTRKGFVSDLTRSVDYINAATDWSLNKPPANIDVAGIAIAAITDVGREDGLDYIMSPEVQNDPKKKLNLAKIYSLTPAVTLDLYNTVDAKKKYPTSSEFRSEVSDAMKAGLRKMDRIKEDLGAQDEVIFAEPEVFKKTGAFGSKGDAVVDFPGKNPNWILNLPDGMQENDIDLKSMYKFVVDNPWSWNHVKASYVDGSDAFNGFMRHEWDVNVGLETDVEVDGITQTTAQKAISELPQATNREALTGNINKTPVNVNQPPTGRSQRLQGERGPGTTRVVEGGGESSLERLTGAPTDTPTDLVEEIIFLELP